MKKLLLILSIILVSATYSHAQAVYDTLNTRKIADGVFHYTVHEASVPLEIQIVEVDLSNPDISLETIAGNDDVTSLETVSSMTTRKTYEGHRVIAGINGDFFGAGPVHTQVINGELLKKSTTSRPLFGFNDLADLFIETVAFESSVKNGAETLNISNVNGARAENYLVLYNHFKGSSTGANAFGTEVTLKVLDTWAVNKEIKAIVLDKAINVGNAALSDSTYVLSGNGTMATALNAYTPGDTLSLNVGLTGAGLDNIMGAVGGDQHILRNGVKVGNWPDLHPRTAVAFNQDKSKLFLMIVDGRYSGSAGMTLQQMGDYLLTIGAYNALNLDGGGSTTMVVHNEVTNRPSGSGFERAVANSLVIVSKAAKIGNLSKVSLYPNLAKVYKSGTFQFSVEGADDNYYPIELDPEKFVFSVSDGFNATINESGLLTPVNSADTGYVYVEYEGLLDSSLVIVKSVYDLDLYPISATTDTSRAIDFYTVVHDFDNKKQSLSNSDINWTVTNPEVGYVSEDGIFKGLAPGTTDVIALHESVADTSTITVELAQGAIILDDFETLDGWVLDGENIDLGNSSLSITDSLSSTGSHSLRIDYEYTFNGDPSIWIHLKKDFLVFGVPDSMVVDVISSDNKKHLMDAVISDNNDELFNVRIKKYVNTSSFEAFPAFIEDKQPVDVQSNFFFPIHGKGLSIKIAAVQETGVLQKGSFFLDNLRLVFPKNEDPVSNEIVKGEGVPSEFVLNQNYPNPFNPSTNISFSLPKASKVQLKVYDLLGREVKVLLNERLSSGTYNFTFDANDLSSGVYLYQIKTDAGVLSKKMTLIK
tara:strand:- start:4632 stop:7085 length:2454 start_codon:yes stop_codon:yes gene_type:complete